MKVTFQYAWMLFSYMLKQVPSEKWLLRKQKGVPTYFLPLLTSLWVLCVAFLVMNVFQSLLVSKLTLKKSSPYIDTPEDLVDKKNIQCLAPREIQIKHVFKKSENAKFRAAWNYISHNMPRSEAFQDRTLRYVESGKYCIIHGHLIFKSRLKEFFKKYGTCNFHLSEKYFYPFSLPIILHKQDTDDFYETFNLGITRLVEADIAGKWFKSDLAISNLCTSYSDTTPKPLGLQHLYGVLVVWLVGMLFGAAIFLVEILTKRATYFKVFPYKR
ncbi:uncharacterized protein [Parasteatoda tepidariorum]|uniref:uncharacterized protein n=1 Tax=Parasteatoda tepidariorum TaxID=114398 RepID=UPI0039BC3DBB